MEVLLGPTSQGYSRSGHRQVVSCPYSEGYEYILRINAVALVGFAPSPHLREAESFCAVAMKHLKIDVYVKQALSYVSASFWGKILVQLFNGIHPSAVDP